MAVAGSEGFVGDSSWVSPEQEEFRLMLFDSHALHSALKLIDLLIDKLDGMINLSGVFLWLRLFADLFLLFLLVFAEQVLFLRTVVVVLLIGLDTSVSWDGFLPLYFLSWMNLNHLDLVVLLFSVLVIMLMLIVWNFFEIVVGIS